MTARVAEILSQTAHRPWPIPKQPWIMTQAWKRLLFAHWPMDPELLKPLLPPGLALDTWQGQAWLGVVPFEMDFRLRFTPWTIRFGELNVRIYVVCEGKPGVLFVSLDASDPLTVYMARRVYSLPYYRADIAVNQRPDGIIEYACQRRPLSNRNEAENSDKTKGHGTFRGQYQPISPVFHAEKNTLEYWLTERYCLYSSDQAGRLYRGNIHHSPWPLQQAQASIEINTMALASGVHLPDSSPILHYADHIDVMVWPLEKVTEERTPHAR